jgi:hypothetical protein
MYNHISKQQVFSLKHQAVRDLAWSIWGPSLFLPPKLNREEPYNEDREYFPFDWSWLCQLDQQPKILNDYLNGKNTRLLGTYFEALWQFYIAYYPRFQTSDDENNRFNLQVIDDGKTLGEFDMLIITQAKLGLHIELACKFYLQWFDKQQQELWIGPNCGDRLDIKYHKTHHKQLPLLQSQLGLRAAVNAFPKQQELVFDQFGIWRGRLFYQHQWFHHQSPELESLLSEPLEPCWMIADKTLWLSPVVIPALTDEDKYSKNTNKPLSANDILLKLDQHFKHQSFTLMLIKLELVPENQQWQQVEQYFITPANWPYGKLADSALTALRPCKPPL